MNHIEARQALEGAIKRIEPKLYPSQALLQYLQGMAYIESHYGKGAATNNWGNVQCSHSPPARDGECVILTDHKVTGEKFKWPYRVYASPEDGAFGMVSLIARKWPKAVQQADIGRTLDASAALYGYYTGQKHTKEWRIMNHAKGTYAAAKEIASALSEKLLLDDPATGVSSTTAGSVMGIVAVLGLVVLASKRIV